MDSVPPASRCLATNRRSRSWLLFVAILPTLTFLGHWPALQLDIPGTNVYVAVPLFGHDGQSVDNAPDAPEDGHEQHCHANASSCSDVPYAGASAFALMHTALASLENNAASIPMFSTAQSTPLSAVLSPDLRPPNTLL